MLPIGVTTGVLGAAGTTVSTVNASAVVALLTLLAASLARKVRLWLPSVKGVADCHCH